MRELISKLILYRACSENTLLSELAEIIDDSENGGEKFSLSARMCAFTKKLLEISTEYGFDGNLWQNYLTYLLVTDENPFTLTCERAAVQSGSVINIAEHDCEIFIKLFHYDFSAAERACGSDLLSLISSYTAIRKTQRMYNKNVSLLVRELSKRLASVWDKHDFFHILTDFYERCGVGIFGLNRAFRVCSGGEGITLEPINNTQDVVLDDLVGCEVQKKQLVDNTEAFLNSSGANNVLLFGDSGTGKSTSVKAIGNMYADRGLRIVELYRHQLRDLSSVISAIKSRNYKFIIFMDDLSFEDYETEYKYLKAVIEGGFETRPDNVLIYATSNRRHLIRESWNDRSDMAQDDELHRSDTVQEKLSLVSRFGVTICFTKPLQDEYNNIVSVLAKKRGIEMDEKELSVKANAWALRHSCPSGRTAGQFIDYLCNQMGKEENK